MKVHTMSQMTSQQTMKNNMVGYTLDHTLHEVTKKRSQKLQQSPEHLQADLKDTFKGCYLQAL